MGILPVSNTLAHGERIVKRTVGIINRRGREKVMVRVVGSSSMGWLESAFAWGGCVEAVVDSIRHRNRVVRKRFSSLGHLDYSSAAQLPPHNNSWDGVMLGTIALSWDEGLMLTMIQAWRPLLVIISLPASYTRSQRENLLHDYDRKISTDSYLWKTFKPSHSELGGVTMSTCIIVHGFRRRCSTNDGLPRKSIMTTENYRRTLQTALDDTVVKPIGNIKFEPRTLEVRSTVDNVVGRVRSNKHGPPRDVYSGQGLAPDLSALTHETRDNMWVECASVRSKNSVPIVRQVEPYELLAMWDYEGKLESESWEEDEMADIINARLASPPGKIIRAFANPAFSFLLSKFQELHPTTVSTSSPKATAGLTKDIPFSPLELKDETGSAATKADDAGIDLSVWALEDETPAEGRARNLLRQVCLRFWKWKIETEGLQWLKDHPKHTRNDRNSIEDCIRRAKACTYWDWTRGSRIFWWRLPQDLHEVFRDGYKFWHLSHPPTGMTLNAPAPSREAEIESRKKVFRLCYRGYIERDSTVKLVCGRFAVVKLTVDDVVADIRVVWNAKSNGHNATLWAPGFYLPEFLDVENLVVKWLPMTLGDYLEMGSPSQDYSHDPKSFIKSDQGDIDVGEHFHNFRTHIDERPFVGARLYKTDSGAQVEECEMGRFNVLHFGGLASPYLATQGENRILEWAMGDRRDIDNPFHWERVVLNLPCSLTYDPSLPRVLKLRNDNELATDQKTYVDDIHVVGRSLGKYCRRTKEKNSQVLNRTQQACKRLRSLMNNAGSQAADRKYRDISFTPGPWAGTICHTDTPFPMKSTTGKKWTRFRDGLNWMLTQIKDGVSAIDTPELRRIAGLGVNVTEVYPEGRPYLKGIYNAMEAFRDDRDIEGWRLQTAFDSALALERTDATRAQASGDYPPFTPVTSEMTLHVKGLLTLFNTEHPIVSPLRPSDGRKVRYTVGDASAEGFGAGTQYPDGRLIGRDGLFQTEFAKGGSNLREAQNQVNHLLDDIKAGLHDGCEVWCATDNAVWSAVWNKGLSTARHLFNLVLQLRLEARKHEVYLHVFHISGDRMIACGMDGWSRGDYDAGISLGYDLRSFLPLNISAFEVKDNKLEGWCKSWMGSDYSPPLEPEDWFGKGHQPGVHIWAPPPAAALVAMKELAMSRHKRPYEVTHVVLIPRLLWQEEWRRRFEKEVDFWFSLKPCNSWPNAAFEPLVIGISFPMIRSYPWLVRLQQSEVVAAGRALSAMPKASDVEVGNYLRKCWSSPRPFPTV